jgi:hypothetical protein
MEMAPGLSRDSRTTEETDDVPTPQDSTYQEDGDGKLPSSAGSPYPGQPLFPGNPSYDSPSDLEHSSPPDAALAVELKALDLALAAALESYKAGQEGPYRLKGQYSRVAFEKWSKVQARKYRFEYILELGQALGSLHLVGDPSQEHERTAAILVDMVKEELQRQFDRILSADSNKEWSAMSTYDKLVLLICTL